MPKRVDKTNYYLDIAETVAERGTCIRKDYGCIIVKNDEIISTGYSGAPRGRTNCIDLGYCTKKKIYPDVHHGGHDACRSVHAEQNAIISAARKDMLGSTIYLVGRRKDNNKYEEGAMSCQMCRKMIINAGIKKIIVRVTRSKYIEVDVDEWIKNDDLLEGITTY
jgi:dCMP deaminase